jgi:hypothetical protein
MKQESGFLPPEAIEPQLEQDSIISATAEAESRKYFEERQEHARQTLEDKTKELTSLLERSGIDFASLTPEDVAKALDLEGEENKTLVKVITNTLRQESAGVPVDQIKTKVLAFLAPDSQLATFKQDFSQGRGWYHETSEGRSVLERISEESKDK